MRTKGVEPLIRMLNRRDCPLWGAKEVAPLWGVPKANDLSESSETSRMAAPRAFCDD